jgi:hypothetical protein
LDDTINIVDICDDCFVGGVMFRLEWVLRELIDDEIGWDSLVGFRE